MGDALAGSLDKLRDLTGGFVLLLPNLLLALLVFLVFYATARLIRRAVRIISARSRRTVQAGLVLGRLSQGAVVLLGLFVALSVVLPSFRGADLIQLLGIGSVAIGFAFRDILQNFLAGILILWTQPFRIGDQIVVKGHEGTVEDILTRATVLRTYGGRRVVIPNANLFTDVVTVNTAYERVRLEYDVEIDYGDDLARAKSLMVDAARRTPGVLPDPPPDALMVGLQESVARIRLRWWVTPPRRADTLDSQDAVLSAVKETLSRHGIELPYPTRQIILQGQG